MTALLVALGGGGRRRAALRRRAPPRRAGCPGARSLVNVVGSFLLGLCVGLALDGHALALVGVGFCGGLTTYSAFAVQTHARGPAARDGVRRRDDRAGARRLRGRVRLA